MSAALCPTPTRNVMDVRTMGGIFGVSQMVAGAGGVITAGQTSTMFQDDLGQGTTGNVVLTRADANFFAGRCQNGEVITIFGLQFQVLLQDPAAVPPVYIAPTAILHQQAIASISVKLNLKGQTYNVGNLGLYPSGLGSLGLPQNGGRAVAPFRLPGRLPIQLTSNDQFYITFTAERLITTPGVNQNIEIRGYCPASTGVELGNLSGA